MVSKMVDATGPQTPADLPPPAFGEDSEEMVRCTRCELRYQPSKSTSALRLTYCSFLCELGDLGFSITGLEHMQRTPKELDSPAPEEEQGEPAAVD